MNHNLNSSLINELYKFGLNPQDWNLEKDKNCDHLYLLVNRKDPDFQMLGSLELRSDQNINWSEIQICNI